MGLPSIVSVYSGNKPPFLKSSRDSGFASPSRRPSYRRRSVCSERLTLMEEARVLTIPLCQQCGRLGRASSRYTSKGRTLSYVLPRLQAPSNPGANASRICRRARDSLVFTFASDRPSTCAVSVMLRCCTSRKISTVRYFSGRESRALVSALRSSFCSNASDGISRQSAKSWGV